MKRYAVQVFLLMIITCALRIDTNDSEVVKIGLELKSLKSTNIDSVFINPRFVPLETTKDCIIESYDDIVIVDSTIFILSNSKSQQAIFAFNMKGRFLFKIDSQGRGPDEYLAITAFNVNSKERYIEIAEMKIKKYGFDGKYIGSTLDLMSYGTTSDFLSFNNMRYAFTTGAAIQFQSTGKQTNALSVFDSKWNLVSRGYPVDMGILSSPNSLRSKSFFSDTKNAYFSNAYSDTIYRLQGKTLLPKYKLDYGQNGLSEKEKLRLMTLPIDRLNEFPDYFYANDKVVIGPEQLCMADGFLYFHILYGYRNARDVFYNRKNGHVVALEIERYRDPFYPETIFFSDNSFFGIVNSLTIHEFQSRKYKNYNDISKGSPFYPTNIPTLGTITPEDNCVLVFFDIKPF